jgi:hypothetical protein
MISALTAVCQGVIPVVTTPLLERGLPQHTTIQYHTFLSTVPLFEALFIFDARLDRCKTYKWRIVQA